MYEGRNFWPKSLIVAIVSRKNQTPRLLGEASCTILPVALFVPSLAAICYVGVVHAHASTHLVRTRTLHGQVVGCEASDASGAQRPGPQRRLNGTACNGSCGGAAGAPALAAPLGQLHVVRLLASHYIGKPQPCVLEDMHVFQRLVLEPRIPQLDLYPMLSPWTSTA